MSEPKGLSPEEENAQDQRQHVPGSFNDRNPSAVSKGPFRTGSAIEKDIDGMNFD